MRLRHYGCRRWGSGNLKNCISEQAKIAALYLFRSTPSLRKPGELKPEKNGRMLKVRCVESQVFRIPAILDGRTLPGQETELLAVELQSDPTVPGGRCVKNCGAAFLAARPNWQATGNAGTPNPHRRYRPLRAATPHARWTMAWRTTYTTPTALALCHHGQEPEDSSPAPHRCGRT